MKQMKVLLALLCVFVVASAEGGLAFRIVHSGSAFETPSRASDAATSSVPAESPVSDSARVWTWRSPFAFVSFSFATSSSSSDSSPSSLSANSQDERSSVVPLVQQQQLPPPPPQPQQQQMSPWGSMLSGVFNRFIQAARVPTEERESSTNFAPSLADQSASRAAAAAPVTPATEPTVDAFSTIRSWIASARARAHAALQSDERDVVTARRRKFPCMRQGRLACIRESARICPDASGFLDALQCLHREKAQLSEECTSFLSTKPLFKCAPDVQDLCPDIESKSQAWQCLASQQDALSNECAVAFESHRYRSFMHRVNRNRQRLQDRLASLMHERQTVSTPVFVEWQQSGPEPSTDTPLQSLAQTSAAISDTLNHAARVPAMETQSDQSGFMQPEPFASAPIAVSPQPQSPPWLWIALGVALLLGMLFVLPLVRQRLTQIQPAQLEGAPEATAADAEDDDEDDAELPEPMSVRFAAAPLVTTVATKV